MNAWSLYFLAKVGLHFAGTLRLHWLPNLVFALALLWPLPEGRTRRVRAWLAWPVAIALLYQDSLLGSPDRLLGQIKGLAGFSAGYLFELLTRAVQPSWLLAAVLAFAVYAVLSRWLRFSTLAVLAILSVPLSQLVQKPAPFGGTALAAATGSVPAGGSATPAAAADSPDALLSRFYAHEQQRRLSFPAQGTPPFDLIVIHVCSLAWDDLDFVGQSQPAVLQRFDLVFKQFNSAASYSGPAAIRVLHGNCGQRNHTQMYDAADPGCLTFPALEKAGFKTEGLLNHDGHYDGFLQTVEQSGGLAGKMQSNSAAPAVMQSFDGSPIRDDGLLLSQWWKQRQTQGGAPVALYYNTISLHDGNRVPGYSSRSSLDTYKPRVTKLLSDLDHFVSELEASGRPVVLMLVPEHGASLRGDKLQISGMREIPGPRITLVPAAIKLIGLPHPGTGTATVVDKPVSYFDLYSLLANLLADNPFAPGAKPLAQRLDTMTGTDYVAENADMVVMRLPDGRYVMKSGETPWTDYDTR